ncbi:MAG: TetR/AcrR family transcriptional regulator [Stappiaceae bacterium]
MRKIAAGLERAFAENGFAEPSVEDLRDAAGVSLRTLYKYMPSRDAMVRAALENRHRRYMALIFTDLPDTPDIALAAIIDRTGDWMKQEASHGCLFHAAVAAAPHDKALRALLERHKGEVARQAVQASQLPGQEADLTLVIEGLTQSWPLYKEEAIASAKRLAAAMTNQ